MSQDYLSSTELEEYVQGVSESPHLWDQYVEHGNERIYKLIVSNNILNCWLICWNEGHDTGFHDHDGSAGGVIVVKGKVSEERLHRASNSALKPKGNVYAIKETFK